MIVPDVKEKVGSHPKMGSRSLTSAGVTVSGVKWTGVAGGTFHCHTARCTCNKDCNNIQIWTVIDGEEEEQGLRNTAPGTYWVGHRRRM